ncbi:WW domain-binding protein 11-like [Frankliniella occidentalis]|uniref:WW domain-binding protein 11-like n=1 Tax=Frankliniella occidentalis TaxID=133901 RepID=A0A9C6TZP5_FRAOC|nr:WW domain-binding protein 11-like [Frankliniella occidentalis]
MFRPTTYATAPLYLSERGVNLNGLVSFADSLQRFTPITGAVAGRGADLSPPPGPPPSPAAQPPGRPVALPPCRPVALPPCRPAALPPCRPAALPRALLEEALN